MKLVALFSGGKDSTYALYKALQQGHEIVTLLTVYSKNHESYMYDTSNTFLAKLQAEAMGLKIIEAKSAGKKEEEVEDLKQFLSKIKAEGVVCGALASDYQRIRVQRVCDELGLKLLAPLWHTEFEQYLRNIVKDGFEVIFTRVAAHGLDERWLGRRLDEAAIKDLIDIAKKTRMNLGGEGGEYDSKVLFGPIFRRRITIKKSKKIWDKQTSSGEFVIEEAALG
ncbi:MAG TPA: diphthine--ammonia ligase [archaeon]|nr:diphthine--ammonia ligase [archaeon]